MGLLGIGKEKDEKSVEFFGNKFLEEWDSQSNYPVIRRVDKIIFESEDATGEKLYKGIENRRASLATERFAYLIELADKEGLSVVPPKLRKYLRFFYKK